MADMRAKFAVSAVTKLPGGEIVKFNAVGPHNAYGPDGVDEDNTFARFTPSASCEIHIQNPDLLGKFEPGQKYYADFTLAK